MARHLLIISNLQNGLPPVLMTLPGYDPSIGASGISSQRYTPEFKDVAVRHIAAGTLWPWRLSHRGGVRIFSITTGS